MERVADIGLQSHGGQVIGEGGGGGCGADVGVIAGRECVDDGQGGHDAVQGFTQALLAVRGAVGAVEPRMLLGHVDPLRAGRRCVARGLLGSQRLAVMRTRGVEVALGLLAGAGATGKREYKDAPTQPAPVRLTACPATRSVHRHAAPP